MNRQILRTAAGVGSISALALLMVACGGSSSSAPQQPANQGPTKPLISTGPTNAYTKHNYIYNLTSTDPEGDAITFSLSPANSEAKIDGNTLKYAPKTQTGVVTLSVLATDSKGAASQPGTVAVSVLANRAPVFSSPTSFSLTGSGASLPSTFNYSASAVDPDGDSVTYALQGSVSAVDNTGASVSGITATVNSATGATTFTGSVPSGKTSVTITFTVRASDVLGKEIDGVTSFVPDFSDRVVTATYFSGNLPPTIAASSIPAVAQNHGIPAPGFQFVATDPNPSDTQTWSVVGSLPAGFSMTAGGLLTWTSNFATGADFAPRLVTVRVTDSGGLTDTRTFTINVIQDTKPNFVTQTYTETVGGVRFFDPSRVRGDITSRLRFGGLNTAGTAGLDAEATDVNFTSSAALPGWRASVLASDSENDAIKYSLETNSVFRHGTTHTNTSAVNYPGVDPTNGEIRWTPNRVRYNDGATLPGGPAWPLQGDQSIENNYLFDDYYQAAYGDAVRNRLDASNWSFTIRAQQLINGVETPGQFNTNTLVIKVEPNDRPWVGALNIIQGAALSHGVYVGGGSSVVGYGRPSIQEPVASDTSTPGTPSSWIWKMQDPANLSLPLASSLADYLIFDPNRTDIDGHTDAIKADFGKRTLTTDVAGIDYLVSGNLDTNATYPPQDPTTNFPAFNAGASTPNGFYNPWLAGTLGNFVVTWAPVRIQYTLSRYIGLGSYGFGIAAEDQYARANSATRNIYPVFGTLRFFNNRFVWKGDTNGETDAAPRGRLLTSGNTETQRAAGMPFLGATENYFLTYLPVGISSEDREWVDAGSTVTYGSDLFGRANSDGTFSGAYASGYNDPAATLPAPAPGAGNYYNASAGAFQTLNGRNDGFFVVGAPYSANPLNTTLNPSSRAAGVVGTVGGNSQTYVQFQGGAPEANPARPNVTQVTVTPSGWFSNHEALGKVVPSNSPYLFALNTADFYGIGLSSTSAVYGVEADDDGLTTGPRFQDLPTQGLRNTLYAPVRWFAGKVQSEVNYQQVLPGRPVWYSPATETNSGPGGQASLGDSTTGGVGVGVGQLDQNGGRLRLSFTWPTIVTNTAAGYPAVGLPNLFEATDIVQAAVPNMSGNARFFFTGNFPSGTSIANGQIANPVAEQGDAANTNFFGKFGLVGITAAADLTPTGLVTSTAPHQPIHAVTDSLWIPNSTNLHFNFPNAYTTPAGGSGYTDIPFLGIRGYVDRIAVPNMVSFLGTLTGIEPLSPLRTNASYNWLALGTRGDNVFRSIWGAPLDTVTNPALIDTTEGDRTFLLWMKKDTVANNAYATWSGSVLVGGGSGVDARGGITTVPHFTMSSNGLTDTQAQISWAKLNGQLGATNQPLVNGTGINNGWKRSEFELLRNIVGAPAQFGLASRVKLVDPSVTATAGLTDGPTFDLPAVNTQEGITQNSLVVYGVRDRGTKTTQNGATYSSKLGEAGVEPGAPVLAQWWNTGNGDVTTSNFPNVIKNYATEWLPSEFTQVVHLNHNYISKVQFPGSTNADGSGVVGNNVAKIFGQIGLVAPAGHTLLNNGTDGVKPVVTPVRQLAINDLESNHAHGSIRIGLKLDIFNGNAVVPASGAPATGAPDYRLYNGNGVGNWLLNGYSNVQVSFQPAVNDLRHPSGYIVFLYEVTQSGVTSILTPMHEFRMGHLGGIGALQTLNLPNLASMQATNPPAPGQIRYYIVKVRNVWMEGSEGAAGHSFDMGKEPWGRRFPMAYADVVSGAFGVQY